jgi:hypothetical protein
MDEKQDKIMVMPMFIPVSMLKKMEYAARKKGLTVQAFVSKLIDDEVKKAEKRMK